MKGGGVSSGKLRGILLRSVCEGGSNVSGIEKQVE